MKNKLLLLVLLFTLPLAAKAAEGLAGATVKHDGDRVTRMESCKADPESCRAARHARKEACRANPEKCRSDRRARREKWCAANPDNCKRVRARMEKCKANPGKCKAERKAKFDARFRKADADGNDAISLAEAETAMPRLLRRFERMDADKDGQVTRAEFEAARKARGHGRAGHK